MLSPYVYFLDIRRHNRLDHSVSTEQFSHLLVETIFIDHSQSIDELAIGESPYRPSSLYRAVEALNLHHGFPPVSAHQRYVAVCEVVGRYFGPWTPFSATNS